MSPIWDGEGGVTDVPLIYERAVISRLHVEFLTAGPTIDRPELHKNHIILRATFAQHIGNDRGARISMEVSDPFSDSMKGTMTVKIISYDSQSSKAVICLSVPLLRNNITLGELLDVAVSRTMDQFQFTTIGDEHPMGCRDFM
jgi:hypothetical protein